ncbi:unnamed protein product [Prorocentrum cordatum]|uniref:Uncharacterized protein n=1 Tax=Prorocentrum cordatum TaxID=2364126 RepID=A0ABN9UUP3_9DINO|nr:unnamed protein product [Polarella glacialis]
MLQLIAIATSAARSRIKREKHNEQYVDKWRAPGARLRRVGGARARGPGALCSVECQRPAPSAHWRPPGRAGRLEAKLQAAQTGSEQAWRTAGAPCASKAAAFQKAARVSGRPVFPESRPAVTTGRVVAKPSARARRLSPKARASPREGPVPLSSGQRAARYSEHGGEGGGGGDGGGGGGKKNRRGSEGARDKFRSHDCDPVRHKVLRAEFRPCANQQSDRRFP